MPDTETATAGAPHRPLPAGPPGIKVPAASRSPDTFPQPFTASCTCSARPRAGQSSPCSARPSTNSSASTGGGLSPGSRPGSADAATGSGHTARRGSTADPRPQPCPGQADSCSGASQTPVRCRLLALRRAHDSTWAHCSNPPASRRQRSPKRTPNCSPVITPHLPRRARPGPAGSPRLLAGPAPGQPASAAGRGAGGRAAGVTHGVRREPPGLDHSAGSDRGPTRAFRAGPVRVRGGPGEEVGGQRGGAGARAGDDLAGLRGSRREGDAERVAGAGSDAEGGAVAQFYEG